MTDDPQPPYGEIADLLREGEVVPFLGAGVNYGARPPHAVWDAKASFPPDGTELSRFLATKSSFPFHDEQEIRDLAKVASYFVEITSRRQLRKRLREVFVRDYPSSDIHAYLAEIRAPLLIITTNYDDLLERALIEAGRPYDLVIHPTDRKDYANAVLWWKHGATEPTYVEPNKLNPDLSKRTVIYKMHGTIDRGAMERDSYVITEDDYVDFLARMTSQRAVPSAFMRHIRNKRFLFMGYGLRDWNLRVVLKNLREPHHVGGGAGPAGADQEENAGADAEDQEEKSWAIQLNPSLLEKSLWGTRHVMIFNVELGEFVRQLREKGSE